MNYAHEKRSGLADRTSRRPDVEEVQQAEHDQHDRDAQLERQTDPRVERDLEGDYRSTDYEQRQRMAYSPDRSDRRRLEQRTLAGHYRRHRNYMIRIGRVAHAEHQTGNEG